MDDAEDVLHQGYIKFAHSLIEKVMEKSATQADDSSMPIFNEIRDVWIEELSNLVDISDKKVGLKGNLVRNAAENAIPIRSPLLLTPLPKLKLGASHKQPKRKLDELVASITSSYCANSIFRENTDNEWIPFTQNKKNRIRPSDIHINDMHSTFDIVIGLALCVNFNGLTQMQRPALLYQGQHQGRLIAIEKWSWNETIKKIRIRFRNGDELLTHWPNRNITTPLSETTAAPAGNQASSEIDKPDKISEEDDEEQNNEESGRDMYSAAAFDDLLGSSSAHDWLTQFTSDGGDKDAIFIGDEVAKLTDGKLQYDYATIATGERISVKQMQEMEEYFTWRQDHPPTFTCNHLAASAGSTSLGQPTLHAEVDLEVDVPEPQLVIIGKGKRLIKGDRIMQLTLQDVYIRNIVNKHDFLLSDIRFQIESEHLFGSSTADAI